MEEKKQEPDSACEHECGCGCGCRSRCRGGRGIVKVLLFLVGGIIGYLIGQHGDCHRMMMSCPMTSMASPAAANVPSK
jgi:hypothetical protein